MPRVHIASFESKNRGSVVVHRGEDPFTIAEMYKHSRDPGIVATLGEKDLARFAPDLFPVWVQKGGGRFLYTAWNMGHLAGAFWIGGEAFPGNRFRNAQEQPPYTAAWRTAYELPEGNGTFEGQGIGKRIALAGIADVVRLTAKGGPQGRPPLAESGIWIETGENNLSGQALYEHLGNTDRSQGPVGFRRIGTYIPSLEEGTTPLELEPRVGMVVNALDIQRFLAAAEALIQFSYQFDVLGAR